MYSKRFLFFLCCCVVIIKITITKRPFFSCGATTAINVAAADNIATTIHTVHTHHKMIDCVTLYLNVVITIEVFTRQRSTSTFAATVPIYFPKEIHSYSGIKHM